MRLHVGVFFYRQERFVEPFFDGCRKLLARRDCFDALRFSVFDDGSPDQTAALIERAVPAEREGFELHLDRNNKGLKARILEFVASAEPGETLFIIGGDDLVLADGMVAACRHLEERRLDALICNARMEQDGRSGLAHPARWPYSLINRSPARFGRFLRTYYPRPLLLQATLFRAEALQRTLAAGWRSRLDDWPLFIRLLAGGCACEFRPDLVISTYVVHSGGTSANQERLLSLVEEVGQEFGLDQMWGPLSLVAFRRAVLRLRERPGPTMSSLAMLFQPRSIAGLLMEAMYRCCSLLRN